MTLLRIILIFTLLVVPLAELAVIIEVGRRVGTLNTVILLIATALAGASLVHRQGTGLIREIFDLWQRGVIPAVQVFDAVLVFAAGLLLLTPGFITDLAGFLLLVPAIRAGIRRALPAWLGRLFPFR